MRLRGGVATSGLTGSIPTPAFNAGYKTNTFTSTFNNDVDLTKSLASGFKWYPYNFFASSPDMSKVVVTGGSPLVILGDTPGPNGQIMTGAVKGSTLVGTAFGGGAYFECVLKFDPTTVTPGGANGWPSFWALAMEHGLFATGADQWPGQAAGYLHFIEVDFMEYQLGGPVLNTYLSTMVDWYGISLVNTNNAPQNVMPVGPPSTLFNAFNNFGALWIPATATTQGSYQPFFNRQPVGSKITWTQYTGASMSPPPTSQPWKFGVMDGQHLSCILGTGPGANMTVLSFNAWQASAANNLFA